MRKEVFRNPILSGFYPDPSVCRVGEDYYLVTSSFTYYPGLPIFHSRDLVHWEQIGHGIERPDQLDYKDCETSLGLWAPTIRYHQGRYYIINTFVSEGRECKRDNFIITAKEPQGPWSDPVFIKGADGIDPSLFFDNDGRLWYAGNYIAAEAKYEGHHGIYITELDPVTFQFIGERVIAWDGIVSRSRWIEAPHIYKRDGYYYLMVAEGGTFINHSIQIARAEHITGPYELCERNPIISHRHLPLHIPIAVVGHGDLVETQHGEWWMVLLGVRTYQEVHYNLGRETYLVPMRWGADGWPMIDNESGMVNEQERLPQLPKYHALLTAASDSFEDTHLSFLWNTIHPAKNIYSLTERAGWLRLYLKPETMEQICTPAFVGRRQQHKCFLAKTVMEFVSSMETEESGISLVQDDRYHYNLLLGYQAGKPILRLYMVERGEKTLVKEEQLTDSSRIYLSVSSMGESYEFYYGYTEYQTILFSSGNKASLLSSQVNEGFTGTYIGMYATSNGKPSDAYADYDWFFYQGED